MNHNRVPTDAAAASAPHSRSIESEKFVVHHGSTILGVARKFSANASDAEDAFQRAIELLLTKAPPVGGEGDLLAWVLTVVKNEALLLRREIARTAPTDQEFFERRSDVPSRGPEQMLLDREQIDQGHEALRRIKPDQLRCLLLRADGLSYQEICTRTGFTYAKVNRCLSDGRSAFRDRMQRIEAGTECGAISGVLSMMADSELDEKSTSDARAHLQNCLACQATLREFRATPARIAAALPLAEAAIDRAQGYGARFSGLVRQIFDGIQSAGISAQERISAASSMQHGAETALAKKLAVVAVASASIVTGGVTANLVIDEQWQPPAIQQNDAAVEQSPQTGVPDEDTTAGDSDEWAEQAAEKALPSREPRISDVIGKDAVVQISPDGMADPSGLGDSVDAQDAYGAPSQEPSVGNGSSDQSSELAP